jgi:hypothetical protein
MSLDHRLREASSVKENVKDLLKDLNDVLEESVPFLLCLFRGLYSKSIACSPADSISLSFPPCIKY